MNRGAGGMPESQLTKLRGVARQIRFKTATSGAVGERNLWLSTQEKKVCIFGIGVSRLVRSGRSPALIVRGGEADSVISAHHRGAARRLLIPEIVGKISENADRTASR